MSQLESLEEIMSNFGGNIQGIFDTKFCNMGREFDSNFSKLSNTLG